MRLFVSAIALVAMMALSTSAAFAGEITGNGQLKPVMNGNSPCSFSGQEDLQWYTTNADTTLVTDPVKGDPAHAQNWGHVKQATGLDGGANSVPAVDWGCNGHDFGLKNGPDTGP